jgi:hypothetical protein
VIAENEGIVICEEDVSYIPLSEYAHSNIKEKFLCRLNKIVFLTYSSSPIFIYMVIYTHAYII